MDRTVVASALVLALLSLALLAPTAPAQAPTEPDAVLEGVKSTYAANKVTQVCVTWTILDPDAIVGDGIGTQEDCFDKPMVGKGAGPVVLDAIDVPYWVYVYTVDTGKEAIGKVQCVSLWLELDIEPGVDLEEDLPVYDSCNILDGMVLGATMSQAIGGAAGPEWSTAARPVLV